MEALSVSSAKLIEQLRQTTQTFDLFSTRAGFQKMTGKIIKVEIVEESGQRLLVTTYEDGRQERTPIVVMPKAKRSSRPYWYWELRTGRRKFF